MNFKKEGFEENEFEKCFKYPKSITNHGSVF